MSQSENGHHAEPSVPQRSEDAGEEPTTGETGQRDVLGSLPRTRPQRASARRAAVRRGSAAAGPDAASTAPAGSGDPQAASPNGSATDAASTTKRSAAKPSRAAKTGARAEPSRAAKTGARAKPSRAAKTGARAKASATATTAPRATKASATARSDARAAARVKPAVPRRSPDQGFESDTSSAVDPPTGVALLGLAVEAAGELAHSGLDAGSRLLRGALSRLPRP